MNKIFDGVCDDEVHIAFLKFGRGEYRDKYLIEGKRQAKKWAVKAGVEYVNFLVRRCLEKVGDSAYVKGVIISTLDLRDEFKFDIVKAGNFQGVRKFQVDGEIEASEIIGLMDKYPKAFFALSFKGVDFVLKIKAKAPVSGKPGKGEDKPVVDFCSLKTLDRELVDELFFGVGEFSEVKINHTITVSDIVYPSNFEELKPVEVREMARRKGIVVREAVVDGGVRTSRAEFVA